MSNIEKMIEQLCPNGVEYVRLGEVCEFRAGWGFPEVEQGLTEGEYPFYKVGDMNNSEMFMDKANNYISEETSKKLKCKPAPKGTIIFPKIGATMNTNKKRILTKKSCYDNNVMGIIAKSVNERFLYYFFSQYKLIDFAKGTGAVPSLDTNRLKNLEIPLPPLPIQEEIVRILDTFTELQAELEAELEARQQQYQYYRDNLLSFDGRTDVEWKKLGDVATFTYGYTAKAQEKGGVRYIRITDITEGGRLNPENCKYIEHTEDVVPYLLQKGDLLIARTGATYGKTLYFDEDYPSAYASFLIKLSIEEIVLPKFYWHYSRSKYYWEQAHRLVGGGAQPQFNTGAISQVAIPIPPLAVQERIVAILDRFDTLVNDISQGLPAEIAARRKQYEYYRDKLLTFKEKTA